MERQGLVRARARACPLFPRSASASVHARSLALAAPRLTTRRAPRPLSQFERAPLLPFGAASPVGVRRSRAEVSPRLPFFPVPVLKRNTHPNSLLTNGVLGILFTALFLVLRVYMKQYQLRLVRFFALRGEGGLASFAAAWRRPDLVGAASPPAPPPPPSPPPPTNPSANPSPTTQHLPFVTIKPPPMPTRGIKALL